MLEWYDHFLKGSTNRHRAAGGLLPDGRKRVEDRDQLAAAADRLSASCTLSGAGDVASRTGQLSTSAPPDGQPPDRYTYDPANPIAERGRSFLLQHGPDSRVPTTNRMSRSVPMSWFYSTEPLKADTGSPAR